MRNDLISIIIPVYKVEKYLNRCVNSVVNQFTDAIVFIETGTVGLVLYELFFLRVFTYSRKINKRIASEYSGEFSQQLRCVVQVAGITAVLCVVNSVYNSALNMDAGYMVYFIFAIPASVDAFMKGNVCYDK